jgi:hypothetical protein
MSCGATVGVASTLAFERDVGTSTFTFDWPMWLRTSLRTSSIAKSLVFQRGPASIATTSSPAFVSG